MSMQQMRTSGGHQADLSSLSLSGMRVGPITQDTEKPRFGLMQEPRKSNPNEQTIFVKKSLSGFGAGFKIPEEYRKKKMQRKVSRKDTDEGEEVQQKEANQITRDEIQQLLNLGSSEGGIGAGKYGNSSKQALTNDLIEGLEKDLEKLKRFEENFRIRKLMSIKGGAEQLKETDETRTAARIANLTADVQEEGAHVIHVDEKRLQLLRHKAGTLDSIKDLNLDELEATRVETAKRLEEMANAYFSTKQNKQTGKMIRKMMGYDKKDKAAQDDEYTFGMDRVDAEDDQATMLSGKKSRRRAQRRDDDDGQDEDTPPTRSRSRRRVNQNSSDDDAPGDKEGRFDANVSDEERPMFGAGRKKSVGFASKEKSPAGLRPSGHAGTVKPALKSATGLDLGLGNRKRSGSRQPRSQTRSVSIGREITRNPASPHREIYEAKYDKYLANKKQKDNMDKRVKTFEKPDFDVTTKGLKSPSKRTKNYTTVVGAELDFKPSGKYDADYLMPHGYEDHLMREEVLKARNDDPFKLLGVSNDDKMAFFLLKWVFNAIKRDSDAEDPYLNGQAYVTKSELTSQISQNQEVMQALKVTDKRKLKKDVKMATCAKEGCFTWHEFCDFYFLRDASFSERMKGDAFYKNINQDGQLITDDNADKKGNVKFTETEEVDQVELYKQKKQQRLLMEFQEVSMTPALEMLLDTRKKKVVDDVDNEFYSMKDTRAGASSMGGAGTMGQSASSSAGFKKGFQGSSKDDVVAMKGFGREKSKCLLLPSQIEMMRIEFESQDSHNEKIVRRADLIMHMRTTPCIVNFIGDNAVQVAGARKKNLTVDQIFHEIELDENYELGQLAKGESAINHKEFISWSDFLSYFEDYKEIEDRNQRTKKIDKAKENLRKSTQPQQAEIHPEEEEFQSLLETEKQRRLQELPKLRPADMVDISEEQIRLLKTIYDKCPKTANHASTLSFFTSMRNDPEIKRISTTIARDPEGHSRMPTETFQQVFDRMEREVQAKTIEWESVIEYFTKRGRPLTKDEIKNLQDQDERIKHEQEEIQRKEEEQERRRAARIMENMAGEEDFEDYKLRQDVENGNGTRESEDSGDDEYGDEYGSDRMDMSDDDEDDLERDVGAGLRAAGSKRGRSARRMGADSEDLSRQTVTVDQYMNKMRSNSHKKGRYGITVPTPFAFDMRDNTKEKGIRERKIEEMVMEKKVEEENMVKHQFRSKPIPASVLVPRYQAIQEANEQRRLRVKQESIEITKQREAPFSFWEREKASQARKKELAENPPAPDECNRPQFRATEIPSICSFPFYEQEMQQKEIERAKRIKQAAKKSHARAAMPERMQQAAEQSKQTRASMQHQEQSQYSFQPKINKPKTGAQFKRMQERFQEQLNKSKSEMTVTKPTTPRCLRQERVKPLERAYVNEGEPGKQGAMAQSIMNKATQGDKFKQALAGQTKAGGATQTKGLGATGGSRMSATSKGPVKQPSSTRANTLLQQRRREEIEKNKRIEEAKLKEDADRKARQNTLKTAFQEKMKPMLNNAQSGIDAKAKELRIAAIEEEKKTKERLAEIKAKGRQRPMLVDSYNSKNDSSNLARLKTTKEFIKVMKDSGTSEKEAQQFLSMEDKELLEKEKFFEAQKKMYGKK